MTCCQLVVAESLSLTTCLLAFCLCCLFVPAVCVLVQVLGAMSGAALLASLTPSKIKFGMGDGAPGCFDTTNVVADISRGQLFGWEVRACTTSEAVLLGRPIGQQIKIRAIV